MSVSHFLCWSPDLGETEFDFEAVNAPSAQVAAERYAEDCYLDHETDRIVVCTRQENDAGEWDRWVVTARRVRRWFALREEGARP